MNARERVGSTKTRERQGSLATFTALGAALSSTCSTSRVAGEVVPHQDSTFLYTDPPTCVGAWFALEDATLQNGCLWIQPGSHTRGVARRMKLTAERVIAFEGQLPEFDMSSFVPLEVAAGALVLLHGAVWHMSHENTSPRSRHAYSVHFVEERTQWDDANWLQRPTDIPFKALAL
jgi:phytanoyl-CoA hydroxylase